MNIPLSSRNTCFDILLDESVQKALPARVKVRVLRDYSAPSIANPLHPVSVVDEAFHVSSNFLRHYRAFHLGWNWYIYWAPVLYFWMRLRNRLTRDNKPFLLCCIFSALFLLSAVYLLKDVANYSNNLSWRQLLGLFAIYCNGGLYWLVLFLRLSAPCARSFCSE